MQVYLPDGTPVDVSASEAASGIASGKYGVPKSEPVHVFRPDNGKLATVPADQIKQALAGGARLATPEQIQERRLQKEYGGLGSELAAGGLEAASTLTLGGLDVAGAAIGGEKYEQYRKNLQAANPAATIGGGIAGAVVPTLLSGGAAAPEEAEALGLGAAERTGLGAAEAAGTEAAALAPEAASATGGIKAAANAAKTVLGAPTRAVTRAGSAVENFVGRALGATEKDSAIAGLAKKVLAKGAGAATENAMFSMGQQMSEDALGDPDANGEKILASGVYGGLLGFGLGGGLSVAGELGSKILGRAHPTLSGLAEEQAVRALDPRKAFVKDLERIPGGVKGAGRRLLDDEVLRAGDRLEDAAPRVHTKAEAAGKAVGDMLDAADAAGHEGPLVLDINAKIQKEILDPLMRAPKSNAAAINKVAAMMSDIAHFAGVPSEEVAAAQGLDRAAMMMEARLGFRQAQELRNTFKIDWSKGNPLKPIDVVNESAKDVYRAIEGGVEEAGDKAAKAMGSDFLENYKSAKLAYQQYRTLDKAAQDALSAHMANRVISPTDYLAGAASMAHGLGRAAGGALLGGAIGGEGGGEGVIEGAALGAVGALAHHVVRTRGNATAAIVLDRLASLRGVERATQAVDRERVRATAAVFGEKPARAEARIRSLSHTGDPYRERAHAVAQAAAHPDVHSEDVARAAAPITAHAPNTSRAFQSAALRATAYLAARLPVRKSSPSITPQFDPDYRASDAEKASFNRVFDAIVDPNSVLTAMAEGRATKDQIDAVKANHPSIYKEMQDDFRTRLADTTHPLTRQQRLQIGLLLDVTADPTMAPDYVALMQGTYKEAQGAQKPGPQKAPRTTTHPINAPAKNAALTIGAASK